MTIETAIKKIKKDTNQVYIYSEALEMNIPVSKKHAIAALGQSAVVYRSRFSSSKLHWTRGDFYIG